MPVLKRKVNGVWVDVSGISEHVHSIKDITDFPTDIASAQSDWSIADENNPAYIKNKPFGEENGEIQYLDNKYLNFIESYSAPKQALELTYSEDSSTETRAIFKREITDESSDLFKFLNSIAPGETYIVEFGDEKFTCVAEDASYVYTDLGLDPSLIHRYFVIGNGNVGNVFH